MTKNTKRTSSKIASHAAKILQNDNSSKVAKKLAASALSQVNKNNETSSELETVASKVLKSNKYSQETKELAASVLSQSSDSK